MGDAIHAILVFYWATFGSLLVGGLYFVSGDRSQHLLRRLLTSAFAPASALLFLAAVFTQRELWPTHFPLFLALQLAPIALLAYSLVRFEGPRWVHLPLVPLAAVCWVWQALWGHIIIHGK